MVNLWLIYGLSHQYLAAGGCPGPPEAAVPPVPPPPASPGSPAPHSLRRQRPGGAGASEKSRAELELAMKKMSILHSSQSKMMGFSWFSMKDYLKMRFNHEKSKFNHLKCGLNMVEPSERV